MIALPSVAAGCPLPELCASGSLVTSVGTSVAGAVAGGVLEAMTSAMALGASWILAHVLGLLKDSAPVRVTAPWFSGREDAVVGLLELVLAPLLAAASIGAVLRQDVRRLARVWSVGLPVGALGGVAATAFAGLALSATDAMCRVVTAGPATHPNSASFAKTLLSLPGAAAPSIVRLALLVLMIAGAVLVWVELLLRASAVYVATLFLPLALACYVWPATASATKRTVEVLSALILSKLVMVAALGLGAAAMARGRGLDDSVAAGGILLLAGFAPFALLKLAPVVEASAIAHMEGLSRRPGRAASQAVRSVAEGPAQHPVARIVLDRLRGSDDPASTTPVTPQPLPMREPDFPMDGQDER